MSTTLRAALFPLVLTTSAFASSTYVVDDNGGAGVDFTDLPQAVAAVLPGDVLLVRAGNYAGFTLTQPLTMVFDVGARAYAAKFNGIATGITVIAGMTCTDVDVVNCTAPVIFDELKADAATVNSLASPVVYVSACADVRFHRSAIKAASLTSTGSVGHKAATVAGSRVEFASCTLTGGNAGSFSVNGSNPYYGADGGAGLDVLGGSKVHFAQSSATGGNGQTVYAGYSSTDEIYGGDGGPGVRVQGGSITIAGRSINVVRGGVYGTSPFPNQEGSSASGVQVISGSVRYSGTKVLGGSGAPAFAGNPAAITHASPPDATIAWYGNPTPGGSLTVTFAGVSGLNGRLQLGTQPIVNDDGLALIEQLTNRVRIFPLGQLPASGAASYPLIVPATWQPGTLRLFQGLEIDAASGMLVERTNSVAIVVR